MKKLAKIITLLCIVMFFACVVGCIPSTKGEKGEINFWVAVGDVSARYTVDTTGTDMETLEDLMTYLAEQNDNFYYTQTGGMVDSIIGITADSVKQEFWAIYTDCVVDGIPYFDNAWGTTTIAGKTLGSATKGIVELPLQDGATYLFQKSTW